MIKLLGELHITIFKPCHSDSEGNGISRWEKRQEAAGGGRKYPRNGNAPFTFYFLHFTFYMSISLQAGQSSASRQKYSSMIKLLGELPITTSNPCHSDSEGNGIPRWGKRQEAAALLRRSFAKAMKEAGIPTERNAPYYILLLTFYTSVSRRVGKAEGGS